MSELKPAAASNTPIPETSMPEVESEGADAGRRGILKAAGINSLGNVASRLLGMVRESVVAFLFGASPLTGAFDAVSVVPKQVYELLVGGMLSAALVPVLSEYADEERRQELDEILSTLLTLAAIVLVAVTILLELGANWVVPLLVGGFQGDLLQASASLLRLMAPAIIIYGISGLIQAYHYARQDFVYPAMGGAAHNLGFIVTVVVLAQRMQAFSMSLALVVAATAQLVVQLPGLRRARLHPRLDWHNAVVRRILGLYAPVLVSIMVANLGIIIDRNLASRTVPEALTWMAKATTLIQIPLGLVSMAVSLAVLPTLSRIDALHELDRFKSTLANGLRLVLVVIVPAAVGLLVLGMPIVRLLFEHGAFGPEDTRQVWQALLLYLPGLPFAAIDLPLVFAFYGQKDTVTPVIVGIVSVLLYLAVGPALAFWAGWGFLGLVVANSVQLTGHALLMLGAFARKFQGLPGHGLGVTTAKALGASALVALLGFVSKSLLERRVPATGLVGEVLVVVVPAALALVGYVAGCRLLHLEELESLRQMARGRVKGGTH